MNDAVEGQRRLIQCQPGNARAEKGRLDRGDRPGAEPEEAAGAAGVQESVQVFDLGAQPMEVTVRPAPAPAPPVGNINRERSRQTAGQPHEIR